MKPGLRRRQRGFTLLEAMIALLVVAFGMLGLASMQTQLSRSSEVAMQRSEATRLAQQQIETMRAFTTTTGTSAASWATLVASSATPQTRSVGQHAYAVSWSVGGATADKMRPVSVAVTWDDRAGQAQGVTLNTVISQTDPTDAGRLGVPQPSITKRPFNRNINIPVRGIDIPGTGKTAYQINPTLAVVFNNTSGYVVEKCNTVITAENYSDAGCTSYNAYIVAGYVSGAITPTSGGTPTRPTGVNTSDVVDQSGNSISGVTCIYQAATDQNTANTVIDGAHYYLCVVPVSLNGTWSGKIRLGGVPTTANYLVCRYEYASSGTISANERHPDSYTDVNASIDNQNFYIVSAAGGSCGSGSGSTVNSSTGSSVMTGATLVVHQDCRLSTMPTTTNCPLTAANTPSS